MRTSPARPGTLFTSHYVDIRGPSAAASITTRLRESGLVTVDGLMSRREVLAFASNIMTIEPHPHSAPDGLTTIHDTGTQAHRAGFAGLGRGALEAHTERAGVPEPPRLLLLVCLRPATEGGDALLADGVDVLAGLCGRGRETAVALARPRTAYFGAGAGHPSQVFTAHPERRVSVRLRQDGLARWSPVVQPYLSTLRSAIAGCQRRLRLGPGQGYLLDNHRWLHARTAFSGDRLCLRALGHPHVPLLAGFAPDFPTVLLPQANEAV
ncbi:TauD/TfdA family dioxygenase [Streptomyces sp. NBC_00287]|uniref:TauD/TfdA family dioxygenase n=1 Tax=Streptomyces sp. NBC_00287 TaxID=2975702 RepID=UPI002E2BBABF|nr:TauD/TfdA family dioxygenase [Streptomyces sp. NBC_00287]